MKDELNYKDFYSEETIDLKKTAEPIKNNWFVWGGWVLSAGLFIVFIFGGGGSDVKGSVNKTAATIFGTGSSEHLVETIDLNAESGVLDIKEDKKQIASPVILKIPAKININTAGIAELDELAGVGPSVAQKIIDYRNTNGIFRNIEDIKNVAGIGEVTFEKFKSEITVGNVPALVPVPPQPAPPTPAQQPVPPEPVPASPVPPPAPPATQGKININTAGLEELQKITGVGPAIAKKIIDYRTANGLFYRIEDIKTVNGIGNATFEKMKDQITVGNVKAPPPPPPVPAPVPPTPPPAPQPVSPPVPPPTPPPPAPSPPEPTPPSPEPVPPAVPPPAPSPEPSPTPEPTPPPLEPVPEPPPPPPAPEPPPPPAPPLEGDHLLISEVMVGNDENSNNEFIELYNPTANAIDLTGWSIRKKVSSGTESTLVASTRLSGKSIPAGHYFLAVNAAYVSLPSDATWAASNTLAYTNNSITLYDGSETAIDSAAWTDIPKNESLVRDSWDSSAYHIVSTPTPTNSQN